MNNRCPYCGCEMDYLEVVKEAITWNGENWLYDSRAIRAIRCPECGDELDCTDLGILGCEKAVSELKG